MRIKRFTAPDTRTALRLVREEQGPDAVILSNRRTSDGVEIVAASDYDEMLVQQTLRTVATSSDAASVAPAPPANAASPTSPPPAAATATGNNAHGRAVFKIDGVPVEPISPRQQPKPTHHDAAAKRQPGRIEQMMSVFKPGRTSSGQTAAPASEQTAFVPPVQVPSLVERPAPRIDLRVDDDEQLPDFAESLLRAAQAPAPSAMPAAETNPIPAPQPAITQAPAARSEPGTPALRMLTADPAVTALRAELAAMRKVIERELGQFASERLRGCPARAAAMDALLAFGCDSDLSQKIAEQLSPALPISEIAPPIRAALAELLPVSSDEVLEAGGVVALLGPTGAGKTTTIAKLAARYASQHRARDVALVTTDTERAGAREQLHVLGRRLGVTVCDTDGPDSLTHVLEQLADYPLVLVDTAGHGLRDRALLRQILWVRSASNVRSLLVLPANGHPGDLAELLRRYRPAAPEAAILTKLDESICPGAALSVLIQNGLPLAYACSGQHVPNDIELADPHALASLFDPSHRNATTGTHHDEGRHAFA